MALHPEVTELHLLLNHRVAVTKAVVVHQEAVVAVTKVVAAVAVLEVAVHPTQVVVQEARVRHQAGQEVPVRQAVEEAAVAEVVDNNSTS